MNRRDLKARLLRLIARNAALHKEQAALHDDIALWLKSADRRDEDFDGPIAKQLLKQLREQYLPLRKSSAKLREENARLKRPQRSRLWFVYAWFSYMFAAFLLLQSSPATVDTVTDALSQEIFNYLARDSFNRSGSRPSAGRALGDACGEVVSVDQENGGRSRGSSSTPDGAESKGGEPASDDGDITVVLLTDFSLQELGWGWPASFSDHAKVLNAILDLCPKAVMVDFLFPEERGPPDLMLETIADYAIEHVPLYFAEIPGHEPPIYEGLSPAFMDRQRGETAPRLVPVPYEQDYGVVRNYPAVAGAEPTAAFQMYNDIVRRQPRLSRSPARTPIDDDRPLELLWPQRVPNLNRKLMRSCAEGESWGEFVFTVISGNVTGDARQASFEPCRSYPTIPVEVLLTNRMTPELYEGLKKYLTNKVVFYGAAITAASDVAFTPIHGRLPGVYLHAAALDNLLLFGKDYKSKEPAHWITEFGISFYSLKYVIVGILILFMVFYSNYYRECFNDQNIFFALPTPYGRVRLGSRGFAKLLFHICAANFLLLCGGISFWILDVAPFNVLGLWGLLLIISALFDRPAVEIICSDLASRAKNTLITLVRGPRWPK